jgi:cyclophilin family peptidyl-prolyl cis-trans isomerase
MGTTKRERQRANRQSKLQAAQVQQQKRQRNGRVLRIGGLVVAALLAALIYSLVAGDDDSVETATDSPATTAAGEDTEDGAGPPAVAVTAPPPGASITGETPCPPADGSADRTTTFAKAPPTCIDKGKTYVARMTTSKGELTIELDAAKAPATVNNFVVLSRYHYYDGVPFHRIVTDFVAQAGDANPTGGRLGTGGPGYTFPDELPASPSEYVPGVVAMANSGPGTNGSQFFIFVGPNNPFTSNPNYSIFGRVTEGMDTTVAAIMAAGTADQGVTEVVTVEGIEITES